MTKNLASYLKLETDELHKRTEKAFPLFRADFTVQMYKELLKEFYNVYVVFEQKLQDASKSLNISWDSAARAKSPLLATDLSQFSANLNEVNERANIKIFPIESHESFWGTCYVLEGATHGGKVICRLLRQRMGLESHVLNFYRGYGAQTDKMWELFLGLLNQHQPHLNFNKTATYATKTFLIFENIFNRIATSQS